jgi:hypothetical protein
MCHAWTCQAENEVAKESLSEKKSSESCEDSLTTKSSKLKQERQRFTQWHHIYRTIQ